MKTPTYGMCSTFFGVDPSFIIFFFRSSHLRAVTYIYISTYTTLLIVVVGLLRRRSRRIGYYTENSTTTVRKKSLVDGNLEEGRLRRVLLYRPNTSYTIDDLEIFGGSGGYSWPKRKRKCPPNYLTYVGGLFLKMSRVYRVSGGGTSNRVCLKTRRARPRTRC